MAYVKTDWKDKVIERPRTYTIQDNGDGTVTLIPVEGTVYEAGTPVNAFNMNKLETQYDEAKVDFDAHASRTDNPHGVTSAQTGALVSVDGVSNAGGNIDLVAGTNITITPNDAANTITLATTAEVNQNAFANVKVGATTIVADSKTDTLELVAGTNIALTPDTANDKVTIAVTGTVAQATNADTLDNKHYTDIFIKDESTLATTGETEFSTNSTSYALLLTKTIDPIYRGVVLTNISMDYKYGSSVYSGGYVKTSYQIGAGAEVFQPELFVTVEYNVWKVYQNNVSAEAGIDVGVTIRGYARVVSGASVTVKDLLTYYQTFQGVK